MMPSVTVLRGLSANEHARLLDRYAAIDALLQQVISDLQSLERQGFDTAPFVDRFNVLSTQMVKLRADIETLESAENEVWEADASELEAALSTLLDDTIMARSRAAERLEFRGLWWGLGAAALVAAGSWAVWRGSRRRRRR
jgi:hypothetical protein